MPKTSDTTTTTTTTTPRARKRRAPISDQTRDEAAVAIAESEGLPVRTTHVRTRRVENILEELERIQRQITDRAYEIFQRSGATVNAALDNWLAAERATVWRPAIEICEKDGRFVIEAAVAGLESDEIEIQVTPESLLLRADVSHRHTVDKGVVHTCEFQPGQLFRTITLPARIDPESVTANYRNGLLTVIATIATRGGSRKVDIVAA